MNRYRTARLLAAVTAVIGLTGCGLVEEPVTSGEDVTPGEEPVALSVDPAPASGRCMVPTAEALADQTTAFEGTVTALQDGTATLEVDRWFAGGTSPVATVAAPDEDLRALLAAVQFEMGKTYLVSAHEGGQVTLCGFTAEKTPALEAMYAQAFDS